MKHAGLEKGTIQMLFIGFNITFWTVLFGFSSMRFSVAPDSIVADSEVSDSGAVKGRLESNR